jgi:hypothetical protein
MDPPAALAKEAGERGEGAARGVEIDEIAIGAAEGGLDLIARRCARPRHRPGVAACRGRRRPTSSPSGSFEHQGVEPAGQARLGGIADAQPDDIVAVAGTRQGIREALIEIAVREEEIADQEAHRAPLGDMGELIQGMDQARSAGWWPPMRAPRAAGG